MSANPSRVLDLLGEAGLTGRGGAAFSTARKLELAQRHDATLIVNACDGEVGAAKDAWVLRQHLAEVVRGADLLAPSGRVVFAAHGGSATAERLLLARLRVLQVPRRYVSSEESALANLLHGGPAKPVTTWQPISAGGAAPDERRLAPTLVLNAETVWRAEQITHLGAPWFRSYGTEAEPGPRLVSVSVVGGAAPVVLETVAGEPITSLLARAGAADNVGSLNIGGVGGGFLTAAEAGESRWQRSDLAAYDLAPGAGVIRVLPAQMCPWNDVAALVRFAADESARQCGPCLFGLPAVADDVELLVAGRGSEATLARLRHRVGLLPGRGACHHPDGVASLVRSALRCFGEDLDAHGQGRCDHHHRSVA